MTDCILPFLLVLPSLVLVNSSTPRGFSQSSTSTLTPAPFQLPTSTSLHDSGVDVPVTATMVRLATLCALALSISSTLILARPTHEITPRHRHNALQVRAPTSSKSACKTKTSSSAKASSTKAGDEDDSGNSGSGNGGDSEEGSNDNGGGDDGDDGGSVISGSVPAVFPNSGVVEAGWSVAANVPAAIKQETTQVNLATNTFKITAQSKNLPRPIVDHKGKKSMLAHFRKGESSSLFIEGCVMEFGLLTWVLVRWIGAYTLRSGSVPIGGLSFYSPGPNAAPLTFEGAKEVSFGYSIMFSPGFKFNMGGKLPGLCTSPSSPSPPPLLILHVYRRRYLRPDRPHGLWRTPHRRRLVLPIHVP